MKLEWPQWIYILLTVMGLWTCLVKHGEPRTPWDFPSNLMASVIIYILLIAGGFFG